MRTRSPLMNANKTVSLAAFLLGLAVIFGAFGAHGLESKLSAQALDTYHTGVTYHYYHAFGLLLLGLWEKLFQSQVFLAKCLFLVGILLFSFNCYIYALTSIKVFAMIIPLGGLCFVAGWLVFSIKSFKQNSY